MSKTLKFPAPLFQKYTCSEDYINAGIPFLTPMTCLEIEEEEIQDELFNSPDYFIEEKLDGTRGTLFLFKDHCRVFSRRVSKKTGWFAENSDSVPHIRDYESCNTDISFDGTVLDGEMYIPKRPFKDVSATLNCKWDEAILRQSKLGNICIRVFDIRYYKGIKLENMPLHRRKKYLQRVLNQLNSPYIVQHEYYDQSTRIPFTESMNHKVNKYAGDLSSDYPTLYTDTMSTGYTLSPKGFYEYILMCGGEGVILKKKCGKYLEKRGREYQKIKKFITREVIITGYSEPTKEYTGKFPKDRWEFWTTSSGKKVRVNNSSAKEMLEQGFIPVTHYWFNNQIGTIRFGVCISDSEIQKLPKNKKFNIIKCDEGYNIIEVGECAGFDDEFRSTVSLNQDIFLYTVMEIKANEIFSDTGRLRHPRFLRRRVDKEPEDCQWLDHVHASPAYSKDF